MGGDDLMVSATRNPLEQIDDLQERAYLPRNFRVVPPIQMRLHRIVQEARERAAYLSAVTESERIEVVNA